MQYMGSKARFAKYIVPILQKCIDDNDIQMYIEPFVGGANIIDKIKCNERIGLDINPYLIKLLRYIRDNDLSDLPERILFEEYEQVRNSYRLNTNEYPDWYKGFIGFCGSYGSRFFDGGYARNSKNDVTGERTKSAIKNLKEQSPNLKGIKFSCKNYSDINIDSVKNTVFYLDPPYKNSKKYEFNNIDYDEFYIFCKNLKNNNNLVFISEYAMPKDFRVIWEKETNATIDKNAKYRDIKRIEKLFII